MSPRRTRAPAPLTAHVLALAEYERAGACRRPELSACRSAGYEWPGLGLQFPLALRITSRCGGCAEAPRCTQPSSYSGRAISARDPPWDVAGIPLTRAAVAAYLRIRHADEQAD